MADLALHYALSQPTSWRVEPTRGASADRVRCIASRAAADNWELGATLAVVRGLAVVLLASCVVAACSDAGAGGPVPASGTLGAPGTELGDAFSVPEGARLIGAPFPQIDGWTAHLLVDDHVVAVYDRLAEQARAAGLIGIEGSATACVAYDDVESDGTAVGDRLAGQQPLEEVPEAVLAIECSGETGREFDPSSEQHPYPGRSVVISALQGVPRCCTMWQSWAMLTFVDAPGPQAALPDEVSTARAPEIDIIPPAAAALPKFDDVIGEGLDETVLQIVDGSELLVPEFWNGALTGGYTAVLRVTGDADLVLRAYATQIPGTFAPGTTSGTRDGWKVTTAGGEAAGGGSLYVTLSEQDQHAFVEITRSDD